MSLINFALIPKNTLLNSLKNYHAPIDTIKSIVIGFYYENVKSRNSFFLYIFLTKNSFKIVNATFFNFKII